MEPANAQEAAYPPVGPDEAERLLQDARDRAVAQVSAMTTALFDTVAEELRERIDTCTSPDERKLLQRALIASTDTRRQLESAFLAAYLEGFNRALSEQDLTQTGAFSLDQLSLVEDTEMEEDLLVKRLEAFVAECCGEEVSNMERRLTAVLTRPDIRAKNNPFSPRVFAEALREGCRDVIPDVQTRAMLLGAVKKNACQGFMPILVAANEPLAQRVGLPDRRTRPRQERNEQPRRTTQEAATASSGGAPYGAAIPPGASGHQGGQWGEQGEFAAGDFMARLSQMMMTRMPPGAMPSFAGDAAGTHQPLNWGTADAAATTGSMSPQLMSLLTTLQQGVIPEALRTTAAGVAVSPRMLALGTENVVHALRGSDALAPANSMESLTIDVIAMIFDYIFDDESIAPEMKGVIGRLQIPLLKVALLDRQFFATRRHPARRLVDRMAELSNHIDPASENGKILFTRLDGIVTKIQHGFEDNAAIFEESLRQLEDCASSVEAMEQASLTTYTDTIRNDEEREQQLQSLRQRVDAGLPKDKLPAVIREFALGPWCAYLLQLRQTAGENSPQWQAAPQTLEDLLWSIQPKRHAGERDLLIRRLPVLTGVIKESVKAAGYTAAEQERVLDVFMKFHLAAMRSGTDGAPSIAAAAAAAVAAEPAGDDTITALAPPAPRPDLPPTVRQGCWMEFDQDGEIVRVRLSWISPRRSKFLFTRKGQHAFILTETRLAEALALGRAKLIDDTAGSLMDRAAAQAFDTLEAATPPAPELKIPD